MLVAGSSTAPGVAKDEPGSGNARGSCRTSGFMVCWENWLKVRVQSVLVNGATRGFGLSGHHWYSSEFSFRASSVQYIYQCSGCTISASLLVIPNWEVLVTLLRDKRPCIGT